MDVSIGKVQARVESSTSDRSGPAPDDGEKMGPTEKSQRARLEQRRAHRIRDRLSAS